MDKDKDFTKSIISPPGDTLLEHLDVIGMKPGELAERMHLPQETVHDLICGKEPLTADISAKLEHVLDIPSSFWLNREKEYRQELFDSGVGV